MGGLSPIYFNHLHDFSAVDKCLQPVNTIHLTVTVHYHPKVGVKTSQCCLNIIFGSGGGGVPTGTEKH